MFSNCFPAENIYFWRNFQSLACSLAWSGNHFLGAVACYFTVSLATGKNYCAIHSNVIRIDHLWRRLHYDERLHRLRVYPRNWIPCTIYSSPSLWQCDCCNCLSWQNLPSQQVLLNIFDQRLQIKLLFLIESRKSERVGYEKSFQLRVEQNYFNGRENTRHFLRNQRIARGYIKQDVRIPLPEPARRANS